ncbi:hypothetical protein SAMD00019534_081720 [Acytostelium subglobosum LB1]|uniref:hypothetical protein n=1 Tax=Acytostelium subglobosum LB1 TaxID=1410327 RepID=UPI0006449971|nr:hypothetical protein SAMD00019534_081720 [Acytostelium subglobosum LB1]GAM24997.1 hypothetical protein SAMD00019534_081720 [Acytostelium subglobosum LB1]|eukprot:XP_012752086.1 hypothetical protein SAMD00019534_081720 [Acytostelium subglobosum LB1]
MLSPGYPDEGEEDDDVELNTFRRNNNNNNFNHNQQYNYNNTVKNNNNGSGNITGNGTGNGSGNGSGNGNGYGNSGVILGNNNNNNTSRNNSGELSDRSDRSPLLRRSGSTSSSGEFGPTRFGYNAHYATFIAAQQQQQQQYMYGSDTRQLTMFEKVSYGVGEGGLAIYQVIKGFFLNEFLLNVAKVNPMYTALLLFSAKAVDAFSDLFVGSLSDKTVSRWGRRRVWILFGALPLAIFYTALWYVPPVSQINKVLYYQFVVILLSIAYSCVTIPYSAMNAEITEDYDERTSLAGMRMISMMIGGILSSFIHSLLTSVFTTTIDGVKVTNYEKGYLLSGGVWGFIMMIPLAITFFGTRNIPTATLKESRVPFFKGLMLMLNNRAFITVTLLYFFCQIAVQFVQNNLLLYCIYVADCEEDFPYILATLQISVSLFIIVWGKISVIIGKKSVYYLGSIFLLITFGSLYFVPAGNRAMLWGIAAFGGIGVSVAFLIPMSMLPDVIELDELQTGDRREGIFYSLFLFFQKLGLSIGLAVSNFVLEAAHYQAPVGVAGDSAEIIDNNKENPQVVLALRILVSVVPSVIILFSLVAVFFYPITKALHNEAREILKRKREGATVIVES